jgi:regulator of protease activity HflC (stomatin/prohibitin superfamily)
MAIAREADRQRKAGGSRGPLHGIPVLIKDNIGTHDRMCTTAGSLASMALEDILTNRNQLSDDILSEVKESAASYGVEIGRADVKDLMFPGNLEQVMNYVLTAERTSEAKLIEARAKAEVERIDAQTRADAQRLKSEADAAQTRVIAEAEADAQRIKTQAEARDLAEREQAVILYKDNPALLRCSSWRRCASWHKPPRLVCTSALVKM